MNTDLQLVPESLLKKRHDLDALKARRAASLLTNPRTTRKNTKNKPTVRILKPETILCQARSRKNAAVRYNRVQKRGMQKRASDKVVMKTKYWDEEKEAEVEETEVLKQEEVEGGDTKTVREIPYHANSIDANIVFCILLRPTSPAPRTVRRTLSTLRLRKVHEGVFVHYTPQIRKMLHTVEPYVLYGTLSNETVADLVRRRGYCKIEGKRVQLSDNNLIEEHLGDVGLICVEDVIAVLTAGEEVDVELFGRVTKFLWPFRMSARKSKFQRRLLDYKEGKLYGDQGEVMNGYIREML